MKILLATNYLKGSLSAVEAANIIKKTLLHADKSLEIIKIPIADGGDGTLEAIKLYTDYEEKTSQVSDPLGRRISAKWLIINYHGEKTGIIEAAQACGLNLLKHEEYNPIIASTYGVGELILKAVENNCKNIILTVGGSATNDGGKGILEALGIKFLQDDIDLSGLNSKLKDVKISVACDVKNPLCGKNGASYVYAPQKGANSQEVEILDKRLSDFANLTTKITGKDFRNFEGTGAAGGISFGLKSYLDAELISGFDFMAEISGLEDKIKSADVVISTEGQFDSQTLEGKAPFKVAQLAKKYNIRVFIIAGSCENNINLQDSGIKKVFCMAKDNISVENSIKNPQIFIGKAVKELYEFLKQNKL
jgi:glycerate kinase